MSNIKDNNEAAIYLKNSRYIVMESRIGLKCDDSLFFI
nr:MAG TPA: hypothetical protein [Caudoviricetes sp.]